MNIPTLHTKRLTLREPAQQDFAAFASFNASDAARFVGLHNPRDYACDTLGWTTVVSMIAAGNDASVGVATAMGAMREDDYQHPVYGAMGVYRHPAPTGAA